VCVTPGSVIDAAVRLALDRGVAILTFGDMIRVPGNELSLEKAAAQGADVREVVSALQAVDLAEKDPERRFVFVAVGFETTVPVVARSVVLAAGKKLANLHFLVANRLVPPALDALLADKALGIQAFLLPGHVSAVIGGAAYRRVAEAGVPGVITGFEALDILSGIHTALTLIADQTPSVVNCYRRVVRPEGNPRAVALIRRVFQPVDAAWRGIGTIPGSGLELRPEFTMFDATGEYGLRVGADRMPEGCSCGSVLKGVIRPDRCPLFGSACTPQTPVGPCMVSSEGSCAAYYRYEVAR